MTGLLIALVNDQPLFRDALAQVLRTGDQDTEISESGSLDELIGRIDACTEVDLVLLDPRLPGLHDPIGLLYFRSASASLPVIVVSAPCEMLVRRSLHTRREVRLWLRNTQIARELNITEATIKAHMFDQLEKLNVSSRTQAHAWLHQLGGEATGRTSEPAPNAGAERWMQPPPACLPFLAQHRSATNQGAAP